MFAPHEDSEKAFLISQTVTLSYAAFTKRVNQLAHALIKVQNFRFPTMINEISEGMLRSVASRSDRPPRTPSISCWRTP